MSLILYLHQKKSDKSTIVQHLLSTIGEGRMKEFKEAASELGLHHCVKKWMYTRSHH